MTQVLLPSTVTGLGRAYAAATPDARRAMYQEWLSLYGDDAAYSAFLHGVSFISFPEDPAEFRDLHAHPTCTDTDKRAAVEALTDEQLSQIGEALRGEYVRRPSGVLGVWHLAKQMAGVA